MRGIFRQRRDGRYDLTPLADTLRSDADVSVAALARFVGSPQHREHWSHLTDAIRTGRAAVPELRGKPFFEYLVDEPEFARSFNDAMTSVSELAITAVIAGYDFSRYATIVDVGGGHGRLLAAILRRYATCARHPARPARSGGRSPGRTRRNIMSPTGCGWSRDHSSTPCPRAATRTF